MANNFRVRDLIADNVYISENQGNVVNTFGDQLILGDKIFSGSSLFTGDRVSIETTGLNNFGSNSNENNFGSNSNQNNFGLSGINNKYYSGQLFGDFTFDSIPKINDSELIVSSGEQQISGIKYFIEAPRVGENFDNSSEIILSSGEQYISGIKTFNQLKTLLGSPAALKATDPNYSEPREFTVINKKYADENFNLCIGRELSFNANLYFDFPTGTGINAFSSNFPLNTKKVSLALMQQSGFGWGVNYNNVDWLTSPPPNPTFGNPAFSEFYPQGPHTTRSYGVYWNAIADLEKNKSNIVYRSGNQTISGSKTFLDEITFNSASVTAPNQTITNSSSLLTKELADNLYGSNYFAITTGLSSGVDNDAIGKKVHSFTLPSGTWEFECYATLSGSVSTGSQGTRFYLYPSNSYSFYGQNSRSAAINAFAIPQTSSITLTNSNLAFSLYNIANNLISACHLKGTLIINQQTEVPIFISQNIQQTGQPIYLLRGSYLKARKIS
jgi:hypothetical protein